MIDQTTSRVVFAALTAAQQFISNGIEAGHVRMPAYGDDPAHRTPGLIQDALDHLRAPTEIASGEPNATGGRIKSAAEFQSELDRLADKYTDLWLAHDAKQIALRRVREFVQTEVENRSGAGALMTDYEDEAQDALGNIDAALATAVAR